MTDPLKLMLVPVFAIALMLTGCGDSHEGHDHGNEAHAEGDGHDHGAESADTHGTEHELGVIEVAGSVLHVSVGGEAGPNVTLHLDIEIKSGPTPAAIRVWVGDETAAGSIKSKAIGSDGDYHADATCPAELADDAVLWIEIESADGTRTTGSLPLEHHEE